MESKNHKAETEAAAKEALAAAEKIVHLSKNGEWSEENILAVFRPMSKAGLTVLEDAFKMSLSRHKQQNFKTISRVDTSNSQSMAA